MRKHQWRSLLVVCLVLGLATAVSPNAGLVVGWFIAMYVVIRLFFIDHPVVWWYDALFFGVAVGIALLGAGVFAGVCAASSGSRYVYGYGGSFGSVNEMHEDVGVGLQVQ